VEPRLARAFLMEFWVAPRLPGEAWTAVGEILTLAFVLDCVRLSQATTLGLSLTTERKATVGSTARSSEVLSSAAGSVACRQG
jgi:hypothetical protein